MVEALYLPHNYELTTALLELKDHYVTVNHCLHARLLLETVLDTTEQPPKPCLNKENPSTHFTHTHSPAVWIK